MCDLNAIIISILSNDQAARQQGENLLKSAFQENPEHACYNLLASMTSSNEDVSGLAAILLKKKLIDEGILQRSSRQFHSQLKDSLFSLISPEKSFLFLKRLADVLVNFSILDGWVNELMSFIGQWSTHPSPNLKQFAMYLFELATEYQLTLAILKENANSVMGILWNSLQDPNIFIKLAAIKTMLIFMISLNDESVITNYGQVFEWTINIISQAVEDPNLNSEHLIGALRVVSEITDAYKNCWGDLTEKLALLMSSISKSQKFGCDCRSGAVEVLTTLIKKTPENLKNNTFFIQETLALGFSLLTEIDFAFDIEGWSQADSVIGQNEPFSLGKEILRELSVNLSNAVFADAMKLISAHLQAQHWANQHSGILAIGLIAEGCHSAINEILPQLMNSLISFTTSELPRLKWAALSAISTFCIEFEPDFQKVYQSQIIAAILNCLALGNLAKVKSQAAICISDYAKGLLSDSANPKTELIPYLPSLIQAFLSIFSDPTTTPYLQTQIFSALSILAETADTDFSPYYSQIIFGVRNIIISPANSMDEKEVKTYAIKCAGAIIESVTGSPENFKENVNSLLSEFLNIRNMLDEADPIHQAINETLPQFALHLQENFAPFLQTLIAKILENADQVVDIRLTDVESADSLSANKNMRTIQFELKGLGRKQLAISTTSLESKIRACKTLYGLVESLGPLFSQYVRQTVLITTKLVSYKFNSDIRKFALKTICSLPNCCENSQQRESLLIQIIPTILEALSKLKTQAPVEIHRQLKSLLGCMESVESVAVISLGQAYQLSALLAECLKDLFQRKIDRSQEVLMTFSEKILSELEDDENVDDEILKKIMEIVGKMMKSFKIQYQPIFSEFFKNVFGEILYKQNANENEILSSICIFCDYIEATGDLMIINGASPLLEQFIQKSYHSNSDIRQSSVSGIGIVAEIRDSSIFPAYLEKALQAVNYILSLPDSKSEALITSTESATGTLGKIALYYRSDLIGNWLNMLPLKSDPEEARNSHELLLRNLGNLKEFELKIRDIVGEIKKLPNEYLTDEGRNIILQSYL
ncbi:unnamed protein product [Blepharisma stoltei]|uniref:IPO4/5-like TPR repeats domain-containing protein n=1 Tax=Blepharisma stoltei TaxID=1481888 RepID=A0AAU9JXE3_9CILI|nr:unnamed protein product [Blepharisma stoltei]